MASKNADDFLLALRNYLKEIRLDSALTQIEFAKKGGNQHQSAIARLESGSSLNIGIKILYEISQATNLHLWEIIQKAEGYENSTNEDEWSKIINKISLFSPQRKKWLAGLLEYVLSNSLDN